LNTDGRTIHGSKRRKYRYAEVVVRLSIIMDEKESAERKANGKGGEDGQ